MMKNLRLFAFIFAMLVPPSIFAEHHADTNETTRIPAGKVHESCVELEAGTRVEYSFESNTRLSYNVHFHDNEEVIFPIEEHEAENESDRFTAEIDHIYCLMWTNTSTNPVTVQFSYTINSPEK